MGRRERIRAAARKMAERALAANADEATEIGAGVQAVGSDIAPHIEPGSLYWRAPFQFVAEQMAPRVVRHHELPEGAVDDVATYLNVAMNDFAVALVGDFDREHFAAWVGVQRARQEGGEIG